MMDDSINCDFQKDKCRFVENVARGPAAAGRDRAVRMASKSQVRRGGFATVYDCEAKIQTFVWWLDRADTPIRNENAMHHTAARAMKLRTTADVSPRRQARASRVVGACPAIGR
jgi:hypothetical protein